MRWSLRYRFLIPFGLLLASVIGSSIWSARISARRTEQRILAQVRNLVESLQLATYPLTVQVLNQVKQLSGAELFLRDGETILSTSESIQDDRSIQFTKSIGESENLEESIRIGNRRYLIRKTRLPELHRNAGAILMILYPEDLLDDAIADAIRPSLISLCLGLVTIAITLILGTRLVRRIQTLKDRTRLIAAGDFSPMELPTPHDEIRELSQSINEMAFKLSQLQEAVLRSERSRLIAQLAAGLAHQLRNSVAGARLAVQLHQSEHPEEEALQVVLRQLSLMEANLRRLIDLGREPEPQRKLCSLNSILHDVVALLRPQIDHLGIEFHESIPMQSIEMEGDSAQLSDLFLNLLGNAIEATRPGGKVRLSSNLDRSLQQVITEIRDDGPGPNLSIAAKIFDPFITSKPEGIGLGLAVARQAAESHGGSIEWFRDEAETVFRVKLPIQMI